MKPLSPASPPPDRPPVLVAMATAALAFQKVVRAAPHGSKILLLLGSAPLPLMLFRLVLIRLRRRSARARLSPAA